MRSTLFYPTEKELKIIHSHPNVDDDVLSFASQAGPMPGFIIEFECNLDLS